MYYLDQLFGKIISPILVCYEGGQEQFENGKELIRKGFAEKYDVASIEAAKDGSIIITLEKANIPPGEFDWLRRAPYIG